MTEEMMFKQIMAQVAAVSLLWYTGLLTTTTAVQHCAGIESDAPAEIAPAVDLIQIDAPEYKPDFGVGTANFPTRQEEEPPECTDKDGDGKCDTPADTRNLPTNKPTPATAPDNCPCIQAYGHCPCQAVAAAPVTSWGCVGARPFGSSACYGSRPYGQVVYYSSQPAYGSMGSSPSWGSYQSQPRRFGRRSFGCQGGRVGFGLFRWRR